VIEALKWRSIFRHIPRAGWHYVPPAPVGESATQRPEIFQRIARGGRTDSRLRRYVITAVFGCAAAWVISIGYLKFTPKTYTSGFVFVLPGTGAGASMNLDRIGQATTTSTSAFASPELSPTENYRKMLLSHRLLTAAAEVTTDDPDHLPTPKIDLADLTKLITVKIAGRTPREASARADALRTAFLNMLDSLRADEIETRDGAYRNIIAGYKQRLNESRVKLIEYEAKTGLVSTDQYGTIVAAVERLHDQVRDVEGKVAHMRAGVGALTRLLGTTVDQATISMILRGDPSFQAVLEQLAKQDAELALLTSIRGDNNPRVAELRAARTNSISRLNGRAAEIIGSKHPEMVNLRDLSVHDERARLFERLIGQISDTEALEAMRDRMIAQITEEQSRVMGLAPAASHLDDLKRDVQVAEAVFSSALARIDTSKSDFFASYPMVQTLEEPVLPDRPSSPLPVLAVAGGFGANFFILAALVLTWLRIALFQRILKNA
jgi:uncharacterized protein involved in exopolysaccharide biosynthesis